MNKYENYRISIVFRNENKICCSVYDDPDFLCFCFFINDLNQLNDKFKEKIKEFEEIKQFDLKNKEEYIRKLSKLNDY